MTFAEEWDQLRSEAAEQKESRTRINGTSSELPLVPPGPGLPDFSSSSAKKKAAVAALQDHVEPDTKTAGACPEETSKAAAKGFSGWATGSGITKALEGWNNSVKALQGRLSGEKTALSNANRLFQGNDHSSSLLFASPHGTDGTQQPYVPYPSRVSQY
ncbi:hypothetical protein ACFU99_01200 [Streptomyces sp. NPDC057654]|uniref:hypothetical protein n=1 Tax=Streptomyces sp. NPDC057654 TaxID=3346196 RepID=UPI0036C4ACDA